MRVGARRLALLALLAACASCASLRIEPTGASQGTFHSSAWAFTFFGNDYPQEARRLAGANASDSQLPNLIVEEELVFPYFWKLDFLLDLISIRYASVSGTYGPAE